MIKRLKTVARKILPPELLSKRYFKRRFGYPLNLRNPQSFNEKLQWLKLYYYPRNPLAIRCTDKFEVRQYLNEVGLGHCLNTLIGVWNRPEEIVWSDLPEQFAMKCTHGCEYNILCKAKADLDIEKASKQLNAWIKKKYGYFLAEPHYNKIKPRIICEKYLGENIINYKFFCFHGEPLFMYVVQGTGKNKRLTCLDMDQKELPYKQHFRPVIETEGYLDGFEDMARICKCLSHPFPFVRVDLYRVEGRIYLGELTFTPSAGFESFCPKEYDQKLGRFLSLEYPSKTPSIMHIDQI
ncbi:MAG: glycosyl transferase [Clostridiales bacterium]|nr:glycosyl transferase [Clostridiales bacterium]